MTISQYSLLGAIFEHAEKAFILEWIIFQNKTHVRLIAHHVCAQEGQSVLNPHDKIQRCQEWLAAQFI